MPLWNPISATQPLQRQMFKIYIIGIIKSMDALIPENGALQYAAPDNIPNALQQATMPDASLQNFDVYTHSL